jgi:hypothetical protein
MEPDEIQRNQIEMWLDITAELAYKFSEKPEDEITKKDIIKIAHRVEDVVNVLYGKSKIAGWRQ